MGDLDTQVSSKTLPPRLTMAHFWQDFSDEVLSVDRGVPWTFRRMTVNPGAAIRDFVVDRNARMTRPLRYFLIGFALYALLFRFTLGADEIHQMVLAVRTDRATRASLLEAMGAPRPPR